MSQTIVADGRGRLLLPKDLRERLNITPGAAVAVDVDASGAVILRDGRTQLAARLAQLRGVAKDVPGTVDDLIADRRAEAAKDQQD